MKHLSAFFRPVTNALSAWSVGLHSFFSHLLISAGSLPQRNVSVTSASAAIVGTPSRRRRGLMLKHFAFMLLFIIGSLNVWGTEVEVISTLSLSATTQVSSQIEIVEDVLFMSGAKNNANQAPTFNYNATNGTDFRLYKLAKGKSSGYSTFTFLVADGYKLDGIVFKKNSTTASSLSNISAGTGTLSSNSWTPTANTTTQSVTFTYSVANSGSNFSGQIFLIYVTYSSTSGSGSGNPANYNIPKFAVSIPSGTIGVRCSQHSLRQHTLSHVYALSY